MIARRFPPSSIDFHDPQFLLRVFYPDRFNQIQLTKARPVTSVRQALGPEKLPPKEFWSITADQLISSEFGS